MPRSRSPPGPGQDRTSKSPDSSSTSSEWAPGAGPPRTPRLLFAIACGTEPLALAENGPWRLSAEFGGPSARRLAPTPTPPRLGGNRTATNRKPGSAVVQVPPCPGKQGQVAPPLGGQERGRFRGRAGGESRLRLTIA